MYREETRPSTSKSGRADGPGRPIYEVVMCYIAAPMKRVARDSGTHTTNEQIARRVYRALKTPSDNDRTTDPIVAFHFKGKDDYILMRCNKTPEISIKGKDQIAGEVKFFAYSDFKDYDERSVLFKLKDDVTLIELYSKGAIRKLTWDTWDKFCRWLESLDEDGVQISLKLPCLVYESVKHQKPSMQNYIVEAVKAALKGKNSKEKEEE
jgi:hypothetical protein